MPESMFGRPSQYLLPSQPQPSAGGGSGPSDPLTAPVQLAPLPFKDFRFNSIGKQPELLSRISLPQPNSTDYHSPTPSPMSTPPPAFTNDFQSKSSSRPTLFEQLAGSDSGSMVGSSRWNTSISQSNGSLASRIQMNDCPSNDIADAHGTPPLRVNTVRRVTEDASLIPPVEVLPQPPDSSPPTPASWAPTLEPADVHTPAYATPLVNTTTLTTSRIPTPPTAASDAASRGPMEPPSSLVVVDTLMSDLQPSPSATVAIDSLVTRQVRLQSIGARLANLASPLPPPSSQSPPLDPPSITRASADITPNQPSQSQRSSTPIVLHHPYSAYQPSGGVGSSISDTQAPTDDSSLALVLSPTTPIQEFQTQRRAIVAAVQSLNSALNAVHRAQIDSENALALRIRTFEEQHVVFEQTKRAQEAALRQEFQELQQKREELNAKEARLASLEKENKAREEARKGVLAKRQAQEEEKRAAEAKRVQEVQEQIATAMNELKEIEVLKAKCQVEQLASETVQDDLPTEPQEGMNEEERAVIKSRNEDLCAVKHLRRMHTAKVQKLEKANRTLRRLGAERKSKEAEEVERRRVVEKERLRAHAKLERACQLLDAKRRQVEAERKRQEVENDREQGRLLVEQRAHAETQAHGLGRTEATSGHKFGDPSYSEEINATPQQGIAEIADTARIRAAREENTLPPETTNAMNVVDDGKASALHRAVPSPDIHTSPGTSQSKKKKKPISGGVMLAASTAKDSVVHFPPKPLAAPTSLSPSDHAAEKATNPAIPVSAGGGHRSSFPVQLASGFNRTANADLRSTPDYKSAFSRTPKSQTILEANGGNQELNIGPVSGVSPTQQNVNLRHLKRFRGRGEGNDSGDRSVRTVQVKIEENSYPSPKREEHDDQSREFVQASLLMNPPASLPPRPAVIPPPRPRMSRNRREAPASQIGSSSSYPPKSNEPSSTRREAEVTTGEQPQEALPRDTPGSQAMNAPVQLPETTSSLLLGPVYAEPQALESRINAGDRPTQDRGEIYDSTPSEPASATLSHELDGEDPSRSNKRFTDEHRRARNTNGSRRMSDHYSPSSRSTVTSPTQANRLIDSWRPQNSSNGPRAEPMRATSPTVGRKRPSEFNDDEYGRRARRQRDDVWIAQDHDRDRADSYRPHWDRRLDSESDERRATYRAPTSPPDRVRPSDVPRATYDNRTYAPEEPAAPATRWEQSYRRTENDDTYQQRYQPPAPAYNSVADQQHTDDARVGQTYEPMAEERTDPQPDPSLLARMGDTQYFPPRGRGRGEPSRGRGDFGRGRGRGAARGGTALIHRLKPGPSSLEERITGF